MRDIIYCLPKSIAIYVFSFLYSELGIKKEIANDICHISMCRDILRTLPYDNIYLIGIDIGRKLYGENVYFKRKEFVKRLSPEVFESDVFDNNNFSNLQRTVLLYTNTLFGKSSFQQREDTLKKYNIDLTDENNYIDEYPEYLD